MTTVVYTDGACSGNPGPGGWAWAVPGGAFASGASGRTTNQRMEIEAAYEAVKALPGTLRVVSDSTYVVNCFRDRWWEGWLKRNWVNSQRKPVANRDLWEPFIDLVRSRGDVTFQWIKGHSGDPMNDLVDRLAVEAAETQKGRSGDEPPAVVGPPDSVATRAARGTTSVTAPERAASALDDGITGHGLVVFGHRPPELGGYDDNPTARAVLAKLREIFEAKASLSEDLVVVSGVRLGAEMLGAEAAREAGISYVVVLPYPDSHTMWPAATRERFRVIVEDAADVITLQQRVPDSKAKIASAMSRRDAWLARNASEAVVVWDGRDDLLGKLVRSLEDHLGEDVWIIDPGELTTP